MSLGACELNLHSLTVADYMIEANSQMESRYASTEPLTEDRLVEAGYHIQSQLAALALP